MAKAKIIGTGIYVPGEPIGNEELFARLGLNYDISRLENVIGIRQRHMAKLRGIEEYTTDFATHAAEAAIADANIDPAELGLIVVATNTPQYLSPGSAVMVQGRLQKGQQATTCFDLATTCSGFCTALDAVAKMMATDSDLRHAAVIASYNMPAFVRPDDAFGHAIFADGAAAVILQRTDDDDPSGYIGGQLMSDGTQWDFIGIYSGGSEKPITDERLAAGEWGLQNLKALPGDRNLKLWPVIVKRLLEKHGIAIEQVDHLLFTQFNRSIVTQIMEMLGLPLEKTTLTMDRFGYTGCSCIPIALSEAARLGRIKRGDTLALIASGSGLTVASNLLVF